MCLVARRHPTGHGLLRRHCPLATALAVLLGLALLSLQLESTHAAQQPPPPPPPQQQQMQCTYDKVASQCPSGSSCGAQPDDPASPGISATMGPIPKITAPWPMATYSEVVDITPFCDPANTPSDAFTFRANASSWAADCSSGSCPQIFIAGNTCSLNQVQVKKGMKAPAELRFIFSGCSSGRALTLSIYIAMDSAGEASNLVQWMCEVGGLDCKDTSKLASELTTTPKPQNLTSTITVGRKIVEKIVGRGLCNTTGLLSKDTAAATEDGCRLECVQRIEMEIASIDDVDLSKECMGFSFNMDTSSCLLYFGTSVTSSDNATQSTLCVSLEQGMDTYVHDTTVTTTTTSAVVTKKPPLQLNAGLTMAGSVAVRRLISPGSDNDGCFDAVDWYELDTTLSVPSDDWDTLKVFLKGRPGGQYGPANVVPASMVVDKICVLGCDGSLADGCYPPGDNWLIPLLLLTNLLTAIIVYCLLEHCCKPGDQPAREVDSVTYTDGERVKALRSFQGRS